MQKTPKLSLKTRLLIPTIIVLAASIITLSVVLIINQKSQMDGIGKSILATTDKTNKQSIELFKRINTEMAANLAHMTEAVGGSLAECTRTALEKEKKSIQEEMESSLARNAESLVKLMAGVAPAAILANNFMDLISYAKSASQNPEIVYAVYLNPDGDPLTRNLDRKHPKVQEWLKSGEGKKKIDKVLSASKKDPSVKLLEQPVALEGKLLGKALLCVDTSATAQKIEKMSNDFAALIQNNTVKVEEILGKQGQEVTGLTGKLLDEAGANYRASAASLEKVIKNSLAEAQVSTYWTVAVVGGLGIVLVSLILFLLLSRMSNQLRGIVKDLDSVSGRVNNASGQISRASQMLAEGSSSQAAAIEETSSSLEEISSMTKRNAENMDKTRSLVRETNSVMGKASKSMEGLTREMSEIAEASRETQKIIKTIDEISFQTNLLALNAAVEAARAGEAGAGFAVVADEVRNLAVRAAEAAQSTAQLIERTVSRIGAGEELVSTTSRAFEEVAGSTAKIDALIDEIANAVNEEARGVTQINSAVTDMDRVVQQNAANSEESASASADLSSEAERMDLFVKNLVAMVDGAGAGNVSTSREEPIGQGETKGSLEAGPDRKALPDLEDDF